MKRIRCKLNRRNLKRLYARGFLWQNGPAQPLNPAKIAGNEQLWANSINVVETNRYLLLSMTMPTHKTTPYGKFKVIKCP